MQFLQIFYEVCPEIIRSFVHYPETVTGAEVHSIIAVNGRCVPNSSPSGSALSIIPNFSLNLFWVVFYFK